MLRREFLQGLALAPIAAAEAGPIRIDNGRQLFFDDHLVADSTLERTWHQPRIHPASPVLRPETPLEMNQGQKPVASPFSDGVFYDPKDRLFKIWYHAGWFDGIAYATSPDGIRWNRPLLDIEPGTNRVLAKRDGYWRDGATVWLDHEADDPSQRFKMFAYFRRRKPLTPVGEVYTSADGIHWNGPRLTGPCSDNTNFYYDPIRKLWVWSIRPGGTGEQGRTRVRFEAKNFLEGASWRKEDVSGPWLATDDLDLPDPQLGYRTQLYHFTATGYESAMVGLFMILRGPPNEICAKEGIPKITDLTVGFSRDGVNWLRPNRSAFIAASREAGAWNRGYNHNAGGVCLIVNDELYFYYGAWSGLSPKVPKGDMYAGGSTGLAVLRRDGFVSLDGASKGGAMLTPRVEFAGKHLFVNAEVTGGEIAVEVVGQPGYSAKQCIPIRAGGTRVPVRWKDNQDLGKLAGKPVQLRFHVTRAKLYSFWVSQAPTGESNGFIAAGGPGLTGPRT